MFSVRRYIPFYSGKFQNRKVEGKSVFVQLLQWMCI